MQNKKDCCYYNDSIDCKEHERKCNKCGWSPIVKEMRIDKWKKEQRNKALNG